MSEKYSLAGLQSPEVQLGTGEESVQILTPASSGEAAQGTGDAWNIKPLSAQRSVRQVGGHK